MKITSWMVALALISGMSVGMSLFFYSFGSQYGINDVNNLTSLNKINTLAQSLNETSTHIQDQQVGLLTQIFTVVALLWGVFIQMLSLPLLFIGYIIDVNVILGPASLPLWFVGMLSVIIVILIVYKVVAIMGNREEI